MTATPIPRTAAMTVYGDLDVSVLDEMPAGPQADRHAVGQGRDEETAVWAKVRDEVAAGRQAYVVCPLIEREREARGAPRPRRPSSGCEAGELAGLRLGLLHGRVPAAEKEAMMDRLPAGELDVLVATTVIEVGVDVPNATVMVILDADRFGIAQLHQLRGRVGPGRRRVVVLARRRGGRRRRANARLEALVRSDDGFELAEVDLDIRGEGTVFGERQKGRSDLKLASLRRDRELVQLARDAASRSSATTRTSPPPRPRRRARPPPRDEDEEFLTKG